MTLSDLASVGSFVSAVAVLISLLYLSLQVRQAEKNQRALMQQGRASRASDHLDRIATGDVVDAFHKGGRGDRDLTLTELRQFGQLFRSSLYGFEDAYFQYNQKMLDEASFQSTVAIIRAQFSWPGARAMWKRQRVMQDPSFRDFMDKIVQEVKVALPRDELADWKADLAAEMASL